MLKVAGSNRFIPIYKEVSEGRIREEKLTIDLYDLAQRVERRPAEGLGTLYREFGALRFAVRSARL